MEVSTGINPKNLQQVGWCETCGAAAYSTRHSTQLVIDIDESGHITREYHEAVEHHMCPRHKAHYFAHMEEQKRKLEAEQNLAAQKGCR